MTEALLSALFLWVANPSEDGKRYHVPPAILANNLVIERDLRVVIDNARRFAAQLRKEGADPDQVARIELRANGLEETLLKLQEARVKQWLNDHLRAARRRR